MTRPVEPCVVRRLADCIERLPEYVNSSAKMPIVQEVVRKALEQVNSDREALARGLESLAQGDDRDGQLNRGKKYRLDLRDTEDYRKKAEDYRIPVTSVWLSDTDKEALKAGLNDTGILELFERQAADIAELLREHRHPRDAELFRSDFSFVCCEALLSSQGVEVSPGVYKLDLSSWETDAAKPLCDYLRDVADEMDAAPPPSPPPLKPSWNRINGELSFDGGVIRTIRRIGNATNVVLVLDTFQEFGWPDRIDSPLSPDSQKHHATICSLNTGLSRIRFKSDGEGKGFVWECL